MNLRRYLHGWSVFFWAIRKIRSKRHGSGAQPWRYTLIMASQCRWIVDGQMRHPGGKAWSWRMFVGTPR
jgi:hypothetical protein